MSFWEKIEWGYRLFILVLIGFLAVEECKALGTAALHYGLGMESGFIPKGSQKNIGLSWQAPIVKQLYYGTFKGVYFDSGRNITTLYGFVQVGAKIYPLDWFYFYNFFGPGFISQKSDLLGGYFQFLINIGAGWRDPKSGVNIGADFGHISCASTCKPNRGWQFIAAKVGWEF